MTIPLVVFTNHRINQSGEIAVFRYNLSSTSIPNPAFGPGHKLFLPKSKEQRFSFPIQLSHN